jgi:hypothetical protein
MATEFVNYGMSLVAVGKVKFAGTNNAVTRKAQRAGKLAAGKEERMFFVALERAMTKDAYAAHLLKDAVDMEVFMDEAKKYGWTAEEVLAAVNETAGKGAAATQDVEGAREAARARIAARDAAANE